MKVDVTVDFGDVAEKLKELGPKLARKALRRAVSKVGDLWVSEAKSRVHIDSGDLRDSIAKKVSTSKKANALSATVTVGPMFDTKSRKPGDSSQSPAVYGLFEEFGTKKMPPAPWLRPTFDATADKAVQLVADTLADDLVDVVKGK